MPTISLNTHVLQPAEIYTFDDNAFISCSTSLTCHQLALSLNNCANLHLQRFDPIDPPKGSLSLPSFVYHDLDTNLTYYLIDAWQLPNPSIASDLQGCDKIIIIHGMMAFERMIEIYNLITSPQPPIDTADLLAAQQYQAWQQLADNVFNINYFDFRRADRPISSQWPTAVSPLGRQLTRITNSIREFFVSMLVMIDQFDYVNLHK